ncbi:MAG TPA: hypothetical protein VFG92_03505 [Agromyces sp.]|nr:hypothetical protein [Agromyces sp.]
MSDMLASTGAADGVPSFRMLFPSGWTRHNLTVDDERELLDAMRAKIRRLARPDLEFQLTAAVKSSFRELRAKDGIAIYLPTSTDESALVPMSITASRIADPAGGSLDGHVADLFRQHGAEFLGEDHAIVRWRRSFARIAGVEGAADEQVNYLVPVPGASRRAALLLSTSILLDPQEPMEESQLQELIGLSDAIVGTFAWSARGAQAR